MLLYEEIFKLKSLLRKGWIIREACDKNGRYESDAEHCFSMAILALEIMHKENLNLDEAKVLKMILYHELCEIDVGDYTPFDNITKKEKYNQELIATTRIAQKCDMPEILELWLEFEENKTPEAQFVKKLDKLDAVMQSKIYSNIKGDNSTFEQFYSHSEEKVKEFERFINEKRD